MIGVCHFNFLVMSFPVYFLVSHSCHLSAYSVIFSISMFVFLCDLPCFLVSFISSHFQVMALRRHFSLASLGQSTFYEVLNAKRRQIGNSTIKSSNYQIRELSAEQRSRMGEGLTFGGIQVEAKTEESQMNMPSMITYLREYLEKTNTNK